MKYSTRSVDAADPRNYLFSMLTDLRQFRLPRRLYPRVEFPRRAGCSNSVIPRCYNCWYSKLTKQQCV